MLRFYDYHWKLRFERRISAVEDEIDILGVSPRTALTAARVKFCDFSWDCDRQNAGAFDLCDHSTCQYDPCYGGQNPDLCPHG
jgi:hypothetical protein